MRRTYGKPRVLGAAAGEDAVPTRRDYAADYDAMRRTGTGADRRLDEIDGNIVSGTMHFS